MLEKDKLIIEKDKSFKIKQDPATGKDVLMVTNPMGHDRPVVSIRYLRIGESKVGIIASYKDETRSNYCYISMWDGRSNFHVMGEVSEEDSYYIPWMDCFAICMVNKRDHKEKLEYVYVSADKKMSWLHTAISQFNVGNPDNAEICFNKDFGAYIESNTGEAFPIDEVRLNKRTIEFRSGNKVFRGETPDHLFDGKAIYNVKKRYNVQEVLDRP